MLLYIEFCFSLWHRLSVAMPARKVGVALGWLAVLLWLIYTKRLFIHPISTTAQYARVCAYYYHFSTSIVVAVPLQHLIRCLGLKTQIPEHYASVFVFTSSSNLNYKIASRWFICLAFAFIIYSPKIYFCKHFIPITTITKIKCILRNQVKQKWKCSVRTMKHKHKIYISHPKTKYI